MSIWDCVAKSFSFIWVTTSYRSFCLTSISFPEIYDQVLGLFIFVEILKLELSFHPFTVSTTQLKIKPHCSKFSFHWSGRPDMLFTSTNSELGILLAVASVIFMASKKLAA